MGAIALLALAVVLVLDAAFQAWVAGTCGGTFLSCFGWEGPLAIAFLLGAIAATVGAIRLLRPSETGPQPPHAT